MSHPRDMMSVMHVSGGDPVRIEALGDEIAELCARISVAMSRFLRLVAEFDERRGWEHLGFASCAQWLHWRCGIAMVTAHEHVRVSRALRELPQIADQFDRGQLSYSKVRTITRIAEPATEELLLGWAAHATAAQLERIAAGYRRARSLRYPDLRHAHRSLSWTYDDDGCLVIKARLTPEDSAIVIGALKAAIADLDAEATLDPTAGEAHATSFRRWLQRDGAHPAQQRAADALVRVAERSLECGAAVGGDGSDARALVVIHTDDPSLAASSLHSSAEDSDVAGSLRAELADRSSIHPATMLRLACDAGVIRPRAPSLSIGRRTRTVPRGMRRALVLRDRTCRFPGCTNHRADAHHIRHWAHGGATSLDNLVLLCRRHHRIIHEGGFSISLLADGDVVVRRPDGRRLLNVPLPPEEPHRALPRAPAIADLSTAAHWRPTSVRAAIDGLLETG